MLRESMRVYGVQQGSHSLLKSRIEILALTYIHDCRPTRRSTWNKFRTLKFSCQNSSFGLQLSIHENILLIALKTLNKRQARISWSLFFAPSLQFRTLPKTWVGTNVTIFFGAFSDLVILFPSLRPEFGIRSRWSQTLESRKQNWN